jgi:hypothetical protein
MKLVACNHAAHADAILAILNDAIVHSTALPASTPWRTASTRWLDLGFWRLQLETPREPRDG